MAGKMKNLVGSKVGRLTILRQFRNKNKTFGICLCECGKEVTKRIDGFNMTDTPSCGCYTLEKNKEKITPFVDLSGKKFGLWTVIKIDGRNKQKQIMWLCLCECGNIKRISTSTLNYGSSTSCGKCIARDALIKKNTRHGECKINGKQNATTEYRAWKEMKGRCYNINNNNYHNYGARGISVCERWLGKNGWFNFINDIGRKPSPLHSLERIKVNENYQADNCKWATRKEQNSNRRNNVHLTFDGLTLLQSEWCKLIGVTSAAMLTARKKYKEETISFYIKRYGLYEKIEILRAANSIS